MVLVKLTDVLFKPALFDMLAGDSAAAMPGINTLFESPRSEPKASRYLHLGCSGEGFLSKSETFL